MKEFIVFSHEKINDFTYSNNQCLIINRQKNYLIKNTIVRVLILK